MAKILVVDDIRELRILAKRILELSGHEIVCVSSALEAFNMLDHIRFDIIITDKELGQINGDAIIAHVRQFHINTKTILMSAYIDQEDPGDIRLKKPFFPEQLISAVESLLS